jgi:hypothetical protein
MPMNHALVVQCGALWSDTLRHVRAGRRRNVIGFT